MSGGIAGYAQITKAEFTGGLSERNESALDGSIDLAGKLTSFFSEPLSEIPEVERTILVEIEFTKEQEFNTAHSTEQDKFIGTVHMDKTETDGKVSVSVYARVRLGLESLPILLALKEDWIQINIYAKWITEPTKHQKTDKILALVKRINFASAPIVRSPNKVDPEGRISSWLLLNPAKTWKM